MRRTGTVVAVIGLAAAVVGLAQAGGSRNPSCGRPEIHSRFFRSLPACPAPARAAGAVMRPAGVARTSDEPPTFESTPCPDIFPSSAHVDCGFVTVPENRARPRGRMISVAAAVMHAPSSRPKKDPIVFLNGGPSFGAISSFAVDFYFGGASYTEDRDVVLVDTRGTGFSEPRLGCPEFDRAFESLFYSNPFVGSSAVQDLTGAAMACRDRLTATGVDPTAYNTAESAADLDALRRALGYRQWNLIALSADGSLGLTYMRLFPGRIRSTIVDSGMSAHFLWGLDYYRGLNELLERVFDGCAANAACNDAYPNLRRVFFDVVERLQKRPVNVSIPDFQPRPVTVRVDGTVFYIDALFTIFPGAAGIPDSIRPLLSEIWRSAHGELRQVYRERLGTGPVIGDADNFFAQGKTMSYVCRDFVAFITQADLRKAARDIPGLAPLFLDPNYDLPVAWYPFSPAGCRVWNVRVADVAQHRPVRSSIPTLVLAGEYDIGVPPLIVRQVSPTLPNSFYYEFPAAPHIQLADGNPPISDCARSIAHRFLDDPLERPDSSCIDSLPPFDFTP